MCCIPILISDAKCFILRLVYNEFLDYLNWERNLFSFYMSNVKNAKALVALKQKRGIIIPLSDLFKKNQCASSQFFPTPMPVSIFTFIGMAFTIK